MHAKLSNALVYSTVGYIVFAVCCLAVCFIVVVLHTLLKANLTFRWKQSLLSTFNKILGDLNNIFKLWMILMYWTESETYWVVLLSRFPASNCRIDVLLSSLQLFKNLYWLFCYVKVTAELRAYDQWVTATCLSWAKKTCGTSSKSILLRGCG